MLKTRTPYIDEDKPVSQPQPLGGTPTEDAMCVQEILPMSPVRLSWSKPPIKLQSVCALGTFSIPLVDTVLRSDPKKRDLASDDREANRRIFPKSYGSAMTPKMATHKRDLFSMRRPLRKTWSSDLSIKTSNHFVGFFSRTGNDMEHKLDIGDTTNDPCCYTTTQNTGGQVKGKNHDRYHDGEQCRGRKYGRSSHEDSNGQAFGGEAQYFPPSRVADHRHHDHDRIS